MEVLPNVIRAFNIYGDGKIQNVNVAPVYLLPMCILSSSPLESLQRHTFALNSSGVLSMLWPILNAIEVYSPMYLTEVLVNEGDGDAITAIRSQYKVNKNWVGDPCSPKKFSWDGLNCSYGSDSSRILSVNLSASSLTGEISLSFSNLTALEYLDLSYNDLTGSVPESLATLSSLKVLNLKCNKFTGPIPSSILQKSQEGLLTISFDNSTNPCIYPVGQKKKIIVVVVSVVSVVLLILVVFTVWKVRRTKAKHSASQSIEQAGSFPSSPASGAANVLLVTPQKQRSENYHDQRPSNHLNPEIRLESQQQFTYGQLVQITSNFAKVIGEGGFGNVYLGYLQDRKQVAVKVRSQSSNQGTREFLAEAQNLTRIHHRNLVSLVGYCKDGEYLALLYEYMAQGSLSDHLGGKDGRYGAFSWENRLKIVVEAAQGLEYLHKGCYPPLLHRDVKSSNILLADNLEAKLADFGLSRVFHMGNQSYVSTQSVVGTPGYLDPEYHNNFKLSDKSDVYSFGIVLLEIITGEPPIVEAASTRSHIVQRVTPKLARGGIDDIVDRQLRGMYNVNSVWKVLDLAMKCTAATGSQRPTMTQVVIQLKESLEIETAFSNNNQYSRNFDISQTSELELEHSMSAVGPVAR